MLIQRYKMTGLAVVCLSLFVSYAVARGPNQQGGPQRAAGGGNNGNPQQAAGMNANGPRGGAMGGNPVKPQNMPTIEQLAEVMLARFDADGSGSLD